MKERLITLSTALAALLLLTFLLTPQRSVTQKPVSLPTTEDRGFDGLKGLFTWLQREHVSVLSFRKPYTDLNRNQSIPERGNILIINMPAPREISKQEWTALSLWLNKGNNLIILGAVYLHPAWATGENCFCDVKQFLSRYDWTLEEKNTENQPNSNETNNFRETIAAIQKSVQEQLPQDSQLTALSAHPLLQGIRIIETKTTAALLEKPWTLTSNASDKLALRLLSVGDQNLIATWQMNAGAGRIVLMLTPDAFNNTHLNHADNARFLTNLLSQSLDSNGRLLFDDYHFGLSELYDPEHFYKDERLHKTLACLGLFWLIYLIGYTTQLAPVRPVAAKLSTHDFIGVMAEFFARRLNKKILAEALLKHLLADISRQRRLQDEAEAWHWLEQHSKISGEPLRLLKQVESKQGISLLHLSNTITYIRTVTL
jgi:hypothetical protein